MFFGYKITIFFSSSKFFLHLFHRKNAILTNFSLFWKSRANLSILYSETYKNFINFADTIRIYISNCIKMKSEKDPMGAAIADFWKNGVAGRLRVFSPDFEEDEMPVNDLFRSFDEMPSLEQTALRMASGRILDVGAGAGCHTLALQDMGRDVTAIDISPLSVETMRAQGVARALEQDFWTVEEKYDTVLMLMNGIGIAGTLDALPRFFAQIDSILTPGGQLLIDSSDVIYIFEDEDGNVPFRRDAMGVPIDPETGRYYGEFIYQMQYKRTRGEQFPWLYIDFATLAGAAAACGFRAELIQKGDHYDYLARFTRT